MRAHDMPVSAGVRNQQHIAGLRDRQQAIVAEHVGALADRTHDIHELRSRLIEAREVRDLMI